MDILRAFTLILSVSLIVVSAGRSSAVASEMVCRSLVHDEPRLKIEVCEYSSTETLIRVKTHRSREPGTVANALYRNGDSIWTRVWVSAGNGRFSLSDQRRIHRLAENPPAHLGATVSFIRLLSEFLEPGVKLESFDALANIHRRPHFYDTNVFGTWTPICESVGQQRLASYVLTNDLLQTPHSSIWPVGFMDTKCKGRCGLGCWQPILQVRTNQYTQECLNHDVCYADNGRQLGPCAAAFWAAAASYVFAPDCPLRELKSIESIQPKPVNKI